MFFRQAEYRIGFGQCERNGAWERRKGGRWDSAAVIVGYGIGSGIVAEDERGEEIADAGEVAWDEWYTGGVDEGWRATVVVVGRAD